MKINKKVEEVLNKQVNAEFWSAYLYLSMSAWCESKGLKGFANWMYVQYQEEVAHALKIFNFVLTRSGEIKLEPIAAVDHSWNSVLHMLEETYRHELVVTDLIGNCYEVSVSERDHSTASMLQWYIDEQTEEENNVVAIIDQLKLLGEKGEGIYLLDKELATRIFVDPTIPKAL
jgi:ferritin